MPIFLYRHPETKEIREIIQSVHEDHSYIDENGLKWNREFTIPTASIDTKWDAENPRDFVEKSGRKKGTLGEIFDKSKELSEKREKQRGTDPIQNTFFDKYKDKTGKDHPDLRKKKVKELTKEVMIKLDKKYK